MGKKDKKRAMSREDADEDEETVSKKRLKLSTKESKSKKAEDKLKNQIVSAETKPKKSKKPKATSTPRPVHVSESESESDAQSPCTYATEQIVSAETKSTKSRKSKSTPTPKPVEPVSESESESDAQPPHRYTADAVFNINRSKASAVVAATTDSSDDSSGAKSLPQTNDKRRTNESTIVRQPMSSTKQNKISNKKPPVSSHTDNSDTEERIHKTGDLDDNIWPSEHLTELINRIERLVPEDDILSYKTRAEHIDWAKVAFNVHTGQQCKDQWDLISKRLRGFRILKELLEDAHVWVSKPWTDFYKGRKTSRHPEMPKKPLSSYFVFYMENKDRVAKENPGLEVTKVATKIADIFKNLPPEKKEKYVRMSTNMKKDYDKKLEHFYKEHPEQVPDPKQKYSEQTGGNKLPSKPPTPFKMFRDNALVGLDQTNHDFDKVAFLKKCREDWTNLSEQRKIFWIDEAMEQEKIYNEKLKTYMLKHPEHVKSPIKSTISKDEKSILERHMGKPVKPPFSAYSLFSRICLSSDKIAKGIDPKMRMVTIAQEWKNCSEDEKRQYADQVKILNDKYKLDYANYLESLTPEKRKEELANSIRKPLKKNGKKPSTEKTEVPIKKKVSKSKAKKSTTQEQDQDHAETKTETRLFEGEPEPPPVRVLDLFMQTFNGTKQEAVSAWETLSLATKNKFKKKLEDIKQEYIVKYEEFLQNLPPDILKKYSNFRNQNIKQEDSSNSSSSEESDDEEEDLNNPVTNNADVVIKHRTTETTTIMDIKNNYSAIFARTQISNSPAKSQENVNFNNRKIFGKHCTNTPPASFRQKECLTRDININLNLKRFADDENDSIVKHKNGLLLNSQMKPKNLTEVDPKLIGVDEKQKVLVIQCTENSDEDIVYSTPGAETKPYYSILSTNIVLKPRDLHEEFDVPSSIKIEPESQSLYDSCVQQTDVAENVEATLPQFVEIGCEPWDNLNKSQDRLKEHEFIKEPQMPPESPFLLFAKKIKSTPENAVREWNLMKLYKRQKYASQLKRMLKVYNNKYWKYLHSLDEIQLVQYITNEGEDVFEVLNKLHGNEAHV